MAPGEIETRKSGQAKSLRKKTKKSPQTMPGVPIFGSQVNDTPLPFQMEVTIRKPEPTPTKSDADEVFTPEEAEEIQEQNQPSTPGGSVLSMTDMDVDESQDLEMEDSLNQILDTAGPMTTEEKAARKTEARRRKLERQEKRKLGQKPEEPCPQCQGEHWLQDCADYKAVKAERKLEKKEKKAAALAAGTPKKTPSSPLGPQSSGKRKRNESTPSSTGEPALKKQALANAAAKGRTSEKLTKRGQKGAAEGAATIYNDGTYLVCDMPGGAPYIPDQEFVPLLARNGLGNVVVAIGPLGKGHQYVKFKTETDAKAAVGKAIIFPKGLAGLKKEVTTHLSVYLTSGPQAYVTDNVGPLSTQQLIELLSRDFPSDTFWMGESKIGAIACSQRVVIFGKPSSQQAWTISMGDGEFQVRFRAVNRRGVCDLCKQAHATLTCGQLVPAVPMGNFKQVLLTRPKIN